MYQHIPGKEYPTNLKITLDRSSRAGTIRSAPELDFHPMLEYSLLEIGQPGGTHQ